MVESELHGFLKKVGAAFLLNQGCFLVDTEVPLTRFGQRRHGELDDHHVIDVCGVGERLSRAPRTLTLEEGLGSYDCEVAENVLRGVEVKVSRSDFRGGLICSGCNYHYVLTPMRLVSPWEVPRGVGLVEFNRYKFSAEPTEEGRIRFRGLRVVRKPTFRRVNHYQVDNATAHIIRQTSEQAMNEVLQGIMEAAPALIYPAA
ncbi:MAG TPA: hypothetical protein VM050_09385 [Patescibacteria group bacterium]|nr:hypothetical protein [Patescibacteria group bacterium]